jgi:hypothetical protein
MVNSFTTPHHSATIATKVSGGSRFQPRRLRRRIPFDVFAP